jgi:hypothetical protein
MPKSIVVGRIVNTGISVNDIDAANKILGQLFEI